MIILLHHETNSPKKINNCIEQAGEAASNKYKTKSVTQNGSSTSQIKLKTDKKKANIFTIVNIKEQSKQS